MAEQPSALPRRQAFSRSLAILGPCLLLVLCIGWLPPISLDSSIAEAAVLVAETGSHRIVPWIALVLLAILISRPRLSAKRRALEALTLLGLLLVALAAMAWLNEHTIKPIAAVPRPNIVELSDSGVLGVEPHEFYAIGDKPERSAYLAERLDHPKAPPLAPAVREHWVEETGYSFPSGHSLAAMTFSAFFLTLALSYLDRRRRMAIFVLLGPWALAVITSRPLLRVHWPTDVAFGAVEGLVLGLAAAFIGRMLLDRQTS